MVLLGTGHTSFSFTVESLCFCETGHLPYIPFLHSVRVNLRATPLLRVKAKINFENAVCRSPRRQHTAFLTVILALTRTSGAALRAIPTRASQSLIHSQFRRSCEPSWTAYGKSDCTFDVDSYERSCSHLYRSFPGRLARTNPATQRPRVPWIAWP